MKKKMSALLCLVMVGSMSLPVFGLTVTPVDMSKVDVLIDGEEIEYGKVYQGDGFTFEFIKSEDIFSPELIEKEKQMLEEGGAKTYNLPNGLKSFADIPPSFWAYDAIMSMTEMGLFAGTTPPVDGVGTFNPNATMTRAQFLVVVTRALFAAELASAEQGNTWYETNYNIAIKNGLITENDLGGFDELNNPISREEMSYVMVNAMRYNGESIDKLIDKSAIPDYDTVGAYYTDSVLTCYSKGIIAGVDMKGSFAPKMTVSRAQGATLIYRLLNPEVRVSVDLDNASD